MQLEIYQWLAPLIATFSIIRTIRQYSKGKSSPRNTVIWIIIWLGIALLGLMPDEIANRLANTFGIRSHINAIIFIALGLLFLMVFYLSAAVNRVENQLTELVRQLALNEMPTKNKINQQQSTIQSETSIGNLKKEASANEVKKSSAKK
jgi:hypothetical protein